MACARMNFTVLLKIDILERERERDRKNSDIQTDAARVLTSELAPDRQRDKYDIVFKKGW